MNEEYTREERQAMRDWLSEQVAVLRALYPAVAVAQDSEIRETRDALMEAIRGANTERDVEVLSMIAGWFILHADKPTLLALIAFISSDDE